MESTMETATNQACRTWSSRSARRGEGRREQQFYRYLGPFIQMVGHGPVFCDVRKAQARSQHKAISCPDKHLTAFCQLGALRLRARRALIFFFDINHAYILAEATQTLSLEDDSVHDPGDQLWMGFSAIPRDVACCEVTVNLPSFSATGDAQDSVLIVNDLTKHQEFRDRPFVQGFPNGRFYAGVPITTPSGVNIGAYCVLDDKPRDGLSPQELVFMRDMSTTVVHHLETLRALSERQQNNDMVDGLGRCIRGTSAESITDAKDTPFEMGPASEEAIHPGVPDALVDAATSPPPVSSYSGRVEYFDNMTVLEQKSPGSVPEDHDTAVATPQQESKTEIESASREQGNDVTPRGDSGRVPSRKRRQGNEARPPLNKNPAVTDRSEAFQRAAEIMCQSLRIDGVAFLDTAVDTFGGLVENTETSTGGDSDDSVPTHSDSGPKGTQAVDRKACKVTGCAQTNRAQKTQPSRPARKLTQSFIRGLLRRNPEGKVWTFGEDLINHSENNSSTDTDDLSTAYGPKSARTARHSDGEALQLAFPGARCIALHGIWDCMRRRWTVAGLYWTYDPFRMLCMEIEMRFIATFCDVIVLETKRLDVVTSDKAKSDFISSVSHELRSPLHGILGSAEVLAEHKLDGSAVTMIEQINSCSYALLDVINHLLDFADLKQQHVKRGAARSSNIGRVLAPSTTTAGDPSKDLTALSMNVLLNDLTESAVMSSVYSYHYNREHERRQQTLVILDVERMDNSSWHCQLATGAWRRICMNLVSNALKFTVKGHVRVSLKARFKAGARRRFDAVLSVTDSGKGMSEEYQRNHLFRHFSQEDTLSNGLGIGMHMVSRMVNAMGGRIEVSSSQKGTGTRITVTVPLEQQRDHGGPDVKQEGAAPSSLAGLKVGFVGRTQEFAATRSQDRVAVAWEMASSSIQKDLKFLGCELQRYPVGSDWPCDLAIVMESDWKDCLASIQEKQVLDTTRFPPILVICNNALTAQTLGASWSKDNSDTKVVVEHLGLPCGLKQLARSASSVLRRHKERMSLPVVEGQHRDAPIAVESLPIRESSPSELKDDSSMSSHSDSGVSDLTTPDLSESPPNAKSIHVPESAAESPPTASPQAEQPEIHNVLAGIPPQSPSSVDEPTPLAPKLPLLLLVDDNKINLKLLETFAKKRQYPYITAVDGQLALDAYVNGHKTSLSPDAASDSSVVSGIPTVILLDINMPVMDGYEAAQRIRAYEKKYRMVPAMIIAVTALGSEAAQAEAYGSGFNVFLSKPLKLKMLTKLLEEI